MRQKARAEADGIVRNAERQIQLETGRALAADPPRSRRPVGDDRVQDASSATSSKEDNEKLIEEALKQIGAPPRTDEFRHQNLLTQPDESCGGDETTANTRQSKRYRVLDRSRDICVKVAKHVPFRLSFNGSKIHVVSIAWFYPRFCCDAHIHTVDLADSAFTF